MHASYYYEEHSYCRLKNYLLSYFYKKNIFADWYDKNTFRYTP